MIRTREEVDSAGWKGNIGIDCEASGLVVLDVDVPDAFAEFRTENKFKDLYERQNRKMVDQLRDAGEVDRSDCWKQIFERYGWNLPPTLISATRSGGLHLFFRAVDGDRFPGHIKTSSGRKFADIRRRHQVVVCPSVVDGRPYRWLNWGEEVMTCPEWLPRSGGKDRRRNGNPGTRSPGARSVEISADGGLRASRSDRKDYAHYLSRCISLDPDGEDQGRNECFNNAAFCLGTEGREDSEFESLIRLARERNLPENAIDRTMRKALERGMAEIPAQPDWMNDWCYVADRQVFVNPDSGESHNKAGFNNALAARARSMTAANLALMDPHFRRFARTLYLPGRPRETEFDGDPVLNSWKPCGLQPEAGSPPDAFLRHMEYLIPDEPEREVALDYLAFCVQNPGRKIRWAMLLQGAQGTGKSYLRHVMQQVLGRHNVTCPSNETMHQKWTTWQVGAQMIVIEEVMALGRLEFMNLLKPKITEDRTEVNEKYMTAFEQPNVYNFLLLTNHPDSIILDRDDRRYFVIHSPAKPEGPAYYTTLWNELESHPGRILDHLCGRDLSDFNPNSHAPGTRARREMIEQSKSSLQQWVDEGIRTREHPFAPDVVSPIVLSEKAPDHLSLRADTQGQPGNPPR